MYLIYFVLGLAFIHSELIIQKLFSRKEEDAGRRAERD
jgi:hypothetical protein